MARSTIPSPDEALAGAAQQGRSVMGREGVAFTAPGASGNTNTTLVPKKGAQAGDPTAGGKANRSNVSAGNAAQSERMGARHRISVKFPAGHDPAASATMANGRVVRSVAGRQTPNFNDGNSASY